LGAIAFDEHATTLTPARMVDGGAEGKIYITLLETTPFSHERPIWIDDPTINPIEMGEGQPELASAPKQTSPKRFLRLHRLLLHFQLPKNRLPTNVNLVPLVLQTAVHPLVLFPKKPQGRHTTHQLKHFVPVQRAALYRRQYNLQLLRQDRFQFQKLPLVVLTKLLRPRKREKLVKLFPAFQVVLDLRDKSVEFVAIHTQAKIDYRFSKARGARKMIAPPRSSLAVNRSAEYCKINSPIGKPAARADLKAPNTNSLISRTFASGNARGSVDTITLPAASTV
jgi:hypothetical protein